LGSFEESRTWRAIRRSHWRLEDGDGLAGPDTGKVGEEEAVANRPLRVRQLERKEDYVVLRLEGELAGSLWTDVIQGFLEEHYVDDGVRRIRVDLAPVSFIDSYGVATLIALYKASLERGKQFSVEGAQGQVLDKLDTTGTRRILEGEGSADFGGGSAT
jgi:anti-anti-sigma factor